MILNVENIESNIKTGEISFAYLLYGEETYLLENTIKKIKKNFGELIKGINYIIIDETNINELISELETPAFGYEKKLIIVKNVNLFKKETKKKGVSTELQTKINEYINENIDMIKDTNSIIFVEQEADNIDLYKTIDKFGVVCNFEKLNIAQIGKKLKAITVAYGVNIDDYTVKYLVENCGTGMQDLINEIRKLIEFSGKGGTITKELVDKLCIKQIDAVIFDLTDNLGSKKTKQAIYVLNGLLANKEPIQRILITLYNHFKKLYITKLAEKENINLAISLNLKPNQMFLTTKYKKQAELFKEDDLRVILKELTNLDTNYKKGKIDLNIGLEAILCNYCSN